MVYTFTYADCAGHTHDWTILIRLLLLILLFRLMAHQPLIVRVMQWRHAPAVTDACGRAITPTLPRHLLLPVTVRWYTVYLCRLCRPHS
jgi:hypothetical protein